MRKEAETTDLVHAPDTQSNPAADERPVIDIQPAANQDFTFKMVTITDITPEAAAVMTAQCQAQIAIAKANLEAERARSQGRAEVARMTHAVPAREETKRAQEEGKRIRWVVLAVLVCAVVTYLKPETGWPLAAVVAVLGTGAAVPSVLDRIRKRRAAKADAIERQ